MDFRHELKHEINPAEAAVMRQRLKAIMNADTHGTDGRYKVRSLYFDTPSDKALFDKINGTDFREKFRLRCYDDDLSFIRLEKKIKQHGMCRKISTVVSRETAALLSEGKVPVLSPDEIGEGSVLSELCFKMQTEMLLPKTIVDYTREAFVFEVGNVRVTLDYDIRTGLSSTDFLDADCVTVPAGSPSHGAYVMEVKWDEFLPEIIRELVQINGRRPSAFSKYAACRI